MTMTLGQRIESCEAFCSEEFFSCATCTWHWQHLLTCSSAPHWFSSWCSFLPPQAVLEILSVLSVLLPLQAAFLVTVEAARAPAVAGRAAEPGWPWQVSEMVFAPFGAIFNDKDDRLCLPITGGSKWILSGKVLSGRGSVLRWALNALSFNLVSPSAH